MANVAVGLACIAVASSVLLTSTPDAQETRAASIKEVPLVIRRLPNGELADGSADDVEALIRKARRQKELILWVTIGVPFQPDLSKLTPEQVDAQRALLERATQKLMAPLIRRKAARYFDDTLRIVGQGFRIIATPEAIEALTANELVVQLVDES